MNQEQLIAIQKTIASSIETNVNGKIRVLTEEFRDHKSHVENYIENDEMWKAEAEPYIKGLSNISGGAKIIIWLAVGVSALIGAFLAIKNILT
jgi:hypothetical protein